MTFTSFESLRLLEANRPPFTQTVGHTGRRSPTLTRRELRRLVIDMLG